MKIVDWVELVSLVALLGLLIFFVVSVVNVVIEHKPQTHNGRVITAAMSPCQCKVAGGCGVSWSPTGNGLYADKTEPEHYDSWGVYSGPVAVHDSCRSVGR